jgi:hypothetical protein
MSLRPSTAALGAPRVPGHRWSVHRSPAERQPRPRACRGFGFGRLIRERRGVPASPWTRMREPAQSKPVAGPARSHQLGLGRWRARRRDRRAFGLGWPRPRSLAVHRSDPKWAISRPGAPGPVGAGPGVSRRARSRSVGPKDLRRERSPWATARVRRARRVRSARGIPGPSGRRSRAPAAGRVYDPTPAPRPRKSGRWEWIGSPGERHTVLGAREPSGRSTARAARGGRARGSVAPTAAYAERTAPRKSHGSKVPLDRPAPRRAPVSARSEPSGSSTSPCRSAPAGRLQCHRTAEGPPASEDRVRRDGSCATHPVRCLWVDSPRARHSAYRWLRPMLGKERTLEVDPRPASEPFRREEPPGAGGAGFEDSRPPQGPEPAPARVTSERSDRAADRETVRQDSALGERALSSSEVGSVSSRSRPRLRRPELRTAPVRPRRVRPRWQRSELGRRSLPDGSGPGWGLPRG